MDDDIDQTEMSITELNESHRSAGSGGHSSSKGSNGGSIPSSPFNAPPKVSGWVEHKYTNISEHRLCEDWSLQWLALEGGFVFWYMNDTMGSPKGFKQLHGLEIGIQDHDTNDENIVVKLSDHNEIHEFCISKINSSIWTDAMYQNKKIGTQDDSATSLADYKMEDIDIALPASMQIHLKGAPHTLSVGPDDDTTKLTEDFVMLHNLKSDIKPRIESELLRTQVDSCIAYQSKLRSQISHLRRLVIENMTHEPRALAAEALASRTADEIIELSQITGDITNKMASLREECDSKNKQIATLTGDLLKEQSAIYEYKLAATTQLENCQNEIEHLQRKLKFSKSQKTFDDPDVMLDAIETIENKSIMVESLKKQLQDKEKQLEHRDQRIEELLKSNKTLETDISKVERSLGECAEDNASLHLKIKEIRSTDQKTIDDLKRRVHEYDDGMKTLRKQLKTLTESEEHSRTTDQLNESKIKKLMEDCKRLTASNHALIQKRELTAMGFEASRQENKSLQEQLKSAEDIVASFKSHSSTKLLRDVTAENNALKEQSIRLRGEVLALQAKIEEIESSAFSAVQSMQLLNPKSSGIPSSHAANHPPSDLFHSDDAGNEEEKVIVELILEEDSSESEYQSERKSTRERRLQNVVPQSSAYDEDECQETDVEVDLNLEQSFADTLTISEKSAAALSPIVEDRLLRNIYHKYTTETSELLTLSRFGRFTKEFKISALVKSSDKYNSSGMKKSEAMLVYGDVDVVFMNTIKNVPVLENDSPLNMSTGTNMTTSAGGSSPRSGAKAQRSFKPGGGKIRSPRTTAMTQIKGSHLSANQFIAAVQDLAVRLYSNVIEEKTGTVLECLPEKQKKMAMRAAMDVMVLKKLMPHASTLGLVPWELMFLDQTLTTIHTSEFASQSLVSHITKISAWFAHYAKLVEISIFSTPGKPMLHSSMSLPSSPTSYIGSPDINCRSPYGVSAGHVINAPEILTFRGISYKALSKFFHDYGVIPYLLKDSQLFSMFTEVNMWAKGNVELLLTALPKEVQELTAVALEMSNQPEVSAKLAKKKILLCGSFFVLFAAVASQAFDETPPERRIQRLFEWSAQSGGSYLMQRKKQFED